MVKQFVLHVSVIFLTAAVAFVTFVTFDRQPPLSWLWTLLLVGACVAYGAYVQPRLGGYPTRVLATRTVTKGDKTYTLELQVVARRSASRYGVAFPAVRDYRWVLRGIDGKQVKLGLLGQNEASARVKFSSLSI